MITKEKMNEVQINSVLRHISNYQGTFALDELQQVKLSEESTFLIINLDKRSQTGSHWIALAINLTNIFVCDSLGGLLPTKSFPRALIAFLAPLLKSRNLFMTKQLQPERSNLCGFYVILFVLEMARHHSFYDFVTVFSSNLQSNDNIIRFLFHKNLERYIREEATPNK